MNHLYNVYEKQLKLIWHLVFQSSRSSNKLSGDSWPFKASSLIIFNRRQLKRFTWNHSGIQSRLASEINHLIRFPLSLMFQWNRKRHGLFFYLVSLYYVLLDHNLVVSHDFLMRLNNQLVWGNVLSWIYIKTTIKL